VTAGLAPTRGERTRTAILICAEELFAERGIDGVTLREIARTAGQSNVSAVQYHFGSKEQLVSAILDRHQDVIDERRRVLLDDQERAGAMHDLDGLMAVLVQPVAAELDSPSGRAYLRIQAERLRERSLRPATRLLSTRISRSLGWDPERSDPLADRFVALLLFVALADRAREEVSGQAKKKGRKPFVTGLMRALLGIFQTFSPQERA